MYTNILVLKRRLGYTRRRFFMEYSIFMALNADTISQQCLPKHVAIIMDGNGRWAQARNRPRVYGHKKGVDAVRQSVQFCTKLGVQSLTLFAFSSENWRRPEDEVNTLMELFLFVLTKEVKKATIIIGLKKYLKHNFKLKRLAEKRNITIFKLNQSSIYQLTKLFRSLIS